MVHVCCLHSNVSRRHSRCITSWYQGLDTSGLDTSLVLTLLSPAAAPLPQAQLQALISEGLNLQDFMFHCLRNCYVVLMNARDESASFSIFATLNGRGINLSPVDKLKADLLQVLESQQQRDWADRWATVWSRHSVRAPLVSCRRQ